jgi:hypothetical protein
MSHKKLLSQTVSREKLQKTLLYEKSACKMFIKLTPGWKDPEGFQLRSDEGGEAGHGSSLGQGKTSSKKEYKFPRHFLLQHLPVEESL